ncbi:MAG TPA: hypothetical protein VHD85_22000 [Terracidiphilus sp.]|jgi:hypothetical protein|nr:hypothetical protein [Terracidiphilus sp.]
MAATTSQGKSFTTFIVGITVAAAGIAYWSSGLGKITCVVGLVVVALSLAGFLKIKPLEGKTGTPVQPFVMQLAGVGAALLGWVIVLFGIHLSSAVTGRLITALVGLAVSLVGVLYFLPAASNKNAIWKA